MLSMKAKYALKALIALAEGEGAMVSARDLAMRAEAPYKFLELILQELRQGGYVDSKRGASGGYFLLKAPSDIFLGDVIRRIDGPLAPIGCASVTAYVPCVDCKDPPSCRVKLLMSDVRNAISDVLDHRCLSELVSVKGPWSAYSI